MSMVRLRDPEKCRICRTRGKVTDSRPEQGYRRRRHRCQCGEKWTSYQMLINPHRLSYKPAAPTIGSGSVAEHTSTSALSL
jgi:hypothetical protein